jgi:hypothetical protein
MFGSPDRSSGFALGVEGDKAGWLYDFFVSTGEKHMADSLMSRAVKEGARQVVTYEHPFLERFYRRFGFETIVRAQHAQLRDPPKEWIPDLVTEGSESVRCPDGVAESR